MADQPIGPLLGPVLPQRAAGRKAEAQARITRQGTTAHAEHVDAGFVGMRLLLSWTNQVDAVPARGETGSKVVHSEGDTVDFRWIGFADDADAHERAPMELTQHRASALRQRGGHMTLR